ncbi:protein affecting phage T7 exclusion by the F plasmid [Beggiatoa alba B18LD]|uniref:Protein affecting phage T7 exclusion by the F plasmid n=1 Tax=Beggiatoa alba B18LD TaxID=395493 RepID=I3CL61_9GAMM|nr:FxsA family protein [Beggiatoa alba]EIJ44354.1 protein affecting phage T7 exclusion by the F plasmid [Beggiatoa alba B18LD]
MLKPNLIFLLFIIVPMIEIYLLITVGNLIGIFPTIFLVIGMAATGVYLLRVQGLATVQNLRNSLTRGEEPTEPLLNGLLILLGGVLLLTPGFLTDFFALFCLVPFTRRALIRYLTRYFTQANYVTTSYTVHTNDNDTYQRQKPAVLEGQFKREDKND